MGGEKTGRRSRAEAAFEAWVDLVRGGGEQADLDDWIAAQPGELRRELRRMAEDYRSLSERMGEASPALEAERELGDFRLVRELGRGGMAVVWEAVQISLDRRVALKLLSPHFALSPSSLERFGREARAGGRLSHPGIVQTYSVGEAEGIHYIAQELVPGGYTLADSLADLRDARELPAGYYRGVASLFAKVADALDHAHRAGVLHRDIKPANILITEADEPRVADFGLARIQDELALSRTGEMEGTPYYMSPEQVAAKRMGLDHRTDVFSLGAALYEALTLARAFEGDTTQSVFHKILTVDPPDARAVRSRVPGDLAVICGKCLEKDWQRRYSSMADLAADLRRHLRGEAILAKPPTASEKTWKWLRRNPTKSVAGLLVLTATVAISTLSARYLHAREVVEDRTGLLWSQQLENTLGPAGSEVRALFEKSWLRSFLIEPLPSHEGLVAESDALWPALPGMIPEYQKWIERAVRLVERLPVREADPATLRALADVLEGFSATATGLLGEDPDAVSEKHGWSIPRRLAAARELEGAFGENGEFHRRWEESISLIGDAYPGLSLRPQIGLVPVGTDPASGLWEFWHVLSGSEPLRAPNGELVMTGDSGVVLVLVPGGELPIGPRGEQPARVVTLPPFFVSKYEMTQGQWARFAGWNPSRYGPTADPGPVASRDGEVLGLLHPVEQVSWHDCVTVLGRLGLTPPSEAHWEYAARAGTRTPWWTGATRESLSGAANLFEQQRAAGTSEGRDGSKHPHLPVNDLLPNGFGLHHVHGNVSEWCLDGFVGNPLEGGVAKDALVAREGQAAPVIRGGGFFTPADRARSSSRDFAAPSTEAPDLGVRPARPIEP